MYSGDRGFQGASGLSGIKQRIGPSISAGLGYTLNRSFDVVTEWTLSNYPGIMEPNLGFQAIDPSESSRIHNGINSSVRYRFGRILGFKPFVSTGFGVSIGKVNGVTISGWGPLLGIRHDTYCVNLLIARLKKTPCLGHGLALGQKDHEAGHEAGPQGAKDLVG
ncbi:hypothetical protein HQ496_08290 [bacterium]|nr:hypothetical protein [bacterium]